jgi:hypothetical protein
MIAPTVIAGATLMVTLLACRKVERHPNAEPQALPPSPAALIAPQATPAPAPPPNPQTCPADRARSLIAVAELRDCSATGDECSAACAKSDASACLSRASVLQRMPDREAEAIALFGRACELGLAIACTNFGASEWSRGGDAGCARRAFDKACAVGEPFACGMIGRMMVEAARDEQSRSAARAYLEATCQRIGGPPCKMLATYLTADLLGAYDPEQIRALIERACDGGDTSACADLGGAP